MNKIMRSNVKLSFGTKLAFAMGDIYAGGYFNIINFFYAIFLTDVVRINPIWAGAIFTVSKVWDAVTDPLMGALSDRTKSKMGRRRPYFIWGIPLIVLSFMMMWFPYSSGSEISKVLFFGLAYMFGNTVSTFVQIPFLSLAAEISTDYKERNSITSVRMIVSLSSSLICAVAPMLIVQQYQNIATGYYVMAIAFGLFFALPWLLVFFKVREPEGFAQSVDTKQNIFKPMLDTFRVKSFRRLIYMYLGIFVTMDLIAMIEAYFMTYIVGRAGEISYVLGTLLLCEILFIPIATLAANKTSKITVIVWGSVGWILACLVNFFVTSATPQPLIYAIAGGLGAILSFSLVGIISLFGDVTDVGELYFGARMEGSFFGVQQFTRKCASAVANGLTLGLLGVVGFVSPVPEVHDGVTKLVTQAQSPAVLLTIKSIIAFTALVLLTPTIIFGALWKLTPERHAKLIDYLDKKRASLPVDSETEQEMAYLREHVL